MPEFLFIMKHIYSIFLLFFSLSLFGQHANRLAEKVSEHRQNNEEFEQYQLFSINPSEEKTALYRIAAKDAVVLTLDFHELKRLLNNKPETIEISFPYKNTNITVELFKKELFTESFEVVNENNEKLTYVPGIYYRGIIKGDPRSVVAFSFFENEVVGVAAALGIGNVVVGKAENSNDYIAYTDHTLTKPNPFRCATDKLPENQERQFSVGENSTGKTMTTNCVRIYYEIAYQPFVDNGQSTTATVNWITAVHNNIATLYANDNIQTALSNILIWTSPDPYVYGYSDNLAYFRNFRPSFDGDLGHLVNSPSTTSIAYLNSLCGSLRYAYSGINQFYQDVPVYSWTIMAMTHEMGHAMGSPHTHACAWNGNSTAIDGCGPDAGHDEGCNAPLPMSGTIMSYCHLVSNVGINFANGFGPQPGALIRNSVDSKFCLGTDCINSCTATISDLTFTNVSNTSATVTIVDNISTSWDYRFYPYGSSPSNWNTITSNSFAVSNLSPNTYYLLEAENNCASGSLGISVSRLLLTDADYCNGVEFVDTGGINGDYGDEQTLVKTFYPSATNGQTTLTFTEFDLELDYDFMSIYDGENSNSPVFTKGENLSGNTIPGPFTSTNPTGAITVEFTSDTYVNEAGWKASITCAALSTSDFSASFKVKIYPNPSSSLVHIESKTPVTSLEVYDITGKLVLKKQKINSLQTSFDFETLANGVYFVQIFAGTSSQTLKIVKE